ncbi:hypothetical protein PENTCL1PPCAC_8448, partial [Pristionchus entomophagus]
FLKLCDLGLSRVLMTMGISILSAEPLLAPDGVTSKSHCERAWGIERAPMERRGGRGERGMEASFNAFLAHCVFAFQFYTRKHFLLKFALSETEFHVKM